MHLGGSVEGGVAQGQQDRGVAVGRAVIDVADQRGVGGGQPCAVRADVARPSCAVGEHRRVNLARLAACAVQELI